MTLSLALEARDVSQLPSRRDEDWRWTDLRGLIRELPVPSPEASADASGPFGELGEAELLVVNGRVQGDLGLLNVAEGEQRVVRLRFVSATQATSHGVKLTADLKPGARLTLLESYEGLAPDYLVDADLSFRLGAGARLERIVLAGDDAEGVSVSLASVDLAPGADFAQTVLTDGARRQRLETRVEHPGQDAKVRMDGAYLVADRRHADLTTAVTHAGADGETEQLIKGVVADQGRGVFQGRITVSPGADRTDARMGHHALLLSDRAEVNAKPELLIFADDVACAHGNTVGALNEDALFYAQQRGIPEAEARAMLTEAFIGEVIDRIVHDGAREVARAWAAERRVG
ncbi:Fe-S cluster assembly protein SufD [Phenylobacterium sp.]|uniref:Fe-S cluster assembly protein SufD n=1 Tax=Phenylobacterium sp. TaxID=1871053 RepID=UPI002730387D|nr:Fe-S cluster assembly protein SufD [Phenylobacterium sp.]MDP1873910.1 Fe-S cluster assembly protein SufD [Phenylobacterium sp.]